jgi:hypothetical protein
MTHRTGEKVIRVIRHAGRYRVDRLQLEVVWCETFASTARTGSGPTTGWPNCARQRGLSLSMFLTMQAVMR